MFLRIISGRIPGYSDSGSVTSMPPYARYETAKPKATRKARTKCTAGDKDGVRKDGAGGAVADVPPAPAGNHSDPYGAEDYEVLEAWDVEGEYELVDPG